MVDSRGPTPSRRGALQEISPEKENLRGSVPEGTPSKKGRLLTQEIQNGVSEAPVGKLLAAVQVSLAELKQEVNAAKSLSNSASAVLQTNASLQDVQHRIFTPRTAPSPKAARPLLRLGEARRVPHEESPAPQITTTPPQAMQWLATGVALAQAMQQSKSASLEARLAALEARAAAGGTPLQCSPESRRMTRDIAELGCEAVRAEDLNGILGRLADAEEMLQGLAALPARQGEAHSLQIEQQLALAALQDAVTTCCESMDELQTASEGGQADSATKEALGAVAARLGQAEKALQRVAAQQVGNSSAVAAMAAHRAHLQGSLDACGRQLASLREEVAQLTQDGNAQPTGAAAEEVAALRDKVESLALAGATGANEAARQLAALEAAQRATGADMAAAQGQLRKLSDGLAQANIALADMQDALEEAEHGQAPDHSLQLRSLEARLGKVARSGGMHGDMIRVLAGESEERHAVAMRLQRTLAQECQGAAQRQERLAAELAAAQRSIAQLQGNTSAAPAQARHWPNIPPSTELQAAVEVLQREQVAQREAISVFSTQLVEAVNFADKATQEQLQSVHSAMADQQAHLGQLAAECDRRHETAMRLQQTVAAEAAGLGQQLKALQEAQAAASAALKEDMQAQIDDVAAGTVDLAEGQSITAAGLATAHGKINMLAVASKKQQENIQGLTAETNEQQQTVVRLQKNTAIACHDQLKEFGAALSHVRMQVDDLDARAEERLGRHDEDIVLLQDSLVEVGTVVQSLDAR